MNNKALHNLPEDIDLDYVRMRVEEAGRIAPLIQVRGARPAGHRSAWPDVVREYMDAFGWTEAEARPPIATMKQIEEHDQVREWIIMLSNYCQRRNCLYIVNAVAYGMLRHYDTGRPKYSWRKLGVKFGCSHNTAKKWYEDGLCIILRNLIIGK